MGRRRSSAAVMKRLFAWVRRQSVKVKIFLAVTSALCSILALYFLMAKHFYFIVFASEAVHVAGVLVLIYKLRTQKTCAGLSLKAQLLTALFRAVRSLCYVVLDVKILAIVDAAALLSTLLVICMMWFKLKSTYIEELDNMPLYYVLVPCAILATLIHPERTRSLFLIIPWTFCVYLESVAVLPQLRMMQNAKDIELFTAHYVFALGVSRFLQCAFWILQIYEVADAYFSLVGSGHFWLPMALLAEIVQTFILADFCYYYVKSFMNGQLQDSMPLPV